MENDILKILESMPIDLKEKSVLYEKELDEFTLNELREIYKCIELVANLITSKLDVNLLPVSLNKFAELFDFKIYMDKIPSPTLIEGLKGDIVTILMSYKENTKRIIVDENTKYGDEITRLSIAFCIAQYILDIKGEEYFSVSSFENMQSLYPMSFYSCCFKNSLIDHIAYVLALNVLIPKSAFNEINAYVKSSQLSYDEKINLLAGFFGVRVYDIKKFLEYFDYTMQ